MPVEIVLELGDLHFFKETLAKDSLGAAAVARAEALDENGKVKMVCDETEALDLLAGAQHNFPICFDTIREALRRANFHRPPPKSLFDR